MTIHSSWGFGPTDCHGAMGGSHQLGVWPPTHVAPALEEQDTDQPFVPRKASSRKRVSSRIRSSMPRFPTPKFLSVVMENRRSCFALSPLLKATPGGEGSRPWCRGPGWGTANGGTMQSTTRGR